MELIEAGRSQVNIASEIADLTRRLSRHLAFTLKIEWWPGVSARAWMMKMSRWLAAMDVKMHGRLAAAGLW
jgi:hypothetical protein